MTGQYRETFFEGVKEHSQIKLQAFNRYLTPWAAKVGSTASRVWIVDGFAGAGRYETGDLGSSGMALQFAADVAQRNLKYAVAIYLVEKDSQSFTKLRGLRNRYPTVQGDVVKGDFWSHVGNVQSYCGDEPVFLFVDPFGLADLDFAALMTLCSGLKRVDLMVNFMSPVAKRLESVLPGHLDRAVGGPGWTVETLTDVFCERLAARAAFLRPARLPVATEMGALKYELVMASRHPAAYELWNDEIAREDSAILKRKDPVEVDPRLSEVKSLLASEGGWRRSFSRDKLISDLCVSRCGEFHSSMYRAGVKSLLREGVWLQGEGPIGSAIIRLA